MEKYLKCLEGISYKDWKKLNFIINRFFEMKNSEIVNDTKLAGYDEVNPIVQSLFG